MNRCVTILVLAALCVGCVAMPRHPDGAVLRSLQTIVVVPVAEFKTAPQTVSVFPLFPSGSGSWARELLSDGVAPTPIGLLLVFVATPFLVGKVIADTASAPDGTRTFESGEIETLGPTLDAAQTAVRHLQRTGARQARLADGYVKAAGVEQGFTNPIKRWYSEDITTVDYSGAGLDTVDVILEVATQLLPAPEEGSSSLAVLVRLVDPRTRQVLGRARQWVFNVIHPGAVRNLLLPPALFSRKPSREEFDQAIKTQGDELVAACLTDLGLIAE